jgi:hypothetical protein
MTKKGNFIICDCCNEKVAEFLSEEHTEENIRIIEEYVNIPLDDTTEDECYHL